MTQGNAENHVAAQRDRATTHLCKVNSGCSREESITELVYFWSIANAETNDLCAGGAGESSACFAKCGNPLCCASEMRSCGWLILILYVCDCKSPLFLLYSLVLSGLSKRRLACHTCFRRTPVKQNSKYNCCF